MTNESILKDADGIYDEFATPEKAAESVKLKVGRGSVCFFFCLSVRTREGKARFRQAEFTPWFGVGT